MENKWTELVTASDAIQTAEKMHRNKLPAELKSRIYVDRPFQATVRLYGGMLESVALLKQSGAPVDEMVESIRGNLESYLMKQAGEGADNSVHEAIMTFTRGYASTISHTVQAQLHP